MSERGDGDFTVADLDGMAHVLAAMKEVLRLHPIVYQLGRVASRDEVLPLARPLTTADGTVVSEVAIPRGTQVVLDIWSYNRWVLRALGFGVADAARRQDAGDLGPGRARVQPAPVHGAREDGEHVRRCHVEPHDVQRGRAGVSRLAVLVSGHLLPHVDPAQ